MKSRLFLVAFGCLLLLCLQTSCSENKSEDHSEDTVKSQTSGQISQETDTPSREKENTSEHLASVNELFQAAKVETKYMQLLENDLNSMIEDNPDLRPYRDVIQDFQIKYISWKNIKDQMAELYMAEFSIPELKQLTASIKSPKVEIGSSDLASYQDRLPSIHSKFNEIYEMRVEAHAPELVRMFTEEKKAIKKREDLRNALARGEDIPSMVFTEEELASFGDFPLHKTLSPDGTKYAESTRMGRLMIHSLEPHEVVRSLQGHKAKVNSLAFSGNGKVLATKDVENMVIAWDVLTGEKLSSHIFEHGNPYSKILFLSFDGTMIGIEEQQAGSASKVNVYRREDEKKQTTFRYNTTWTYPAHVFVSFKDGKRVVGLNADGRLRQWSLDRPFSTASFRETKLLELGRDSLLALSHDNSLLLATTTLGKTLVIDAGTGKSIGKYNTIHPMYGNPSFIRGLAIAPDDSFFITSGDDKVLRFWKTQTGQLLKELAREHVALQFYIHSESHQLISLDDDMKVRAVSFEFPFKMPE